MGNMQGNGRNAQYVNEQILRHIDAHLGRVLGQIEHPLGALDPAMRGPDADDEYVEMVVDCDVSVQRALAFGAPPEDEDIARYSHRPVPSLERRRVLGPLIMPLKVRGGIWTILALEGRRF